MVIKRSPGGQACRWRAINFEIHLWSSGKNADCIFGDRSASSMSKWRPAWTLTPEMIHFRTKSVTLSMLIDLLSTCKSTQVKSAWTDLWPQEMFTFSEMLALLRVGKQFRCLRLSYRRPWGLHGDQPSCQHWGIQDGVQFINTEEYKMKYSLSTLRYTRWGTVYQHWGIQDEVQFINTEVYKMRYSLPTLGFSTWGKVYYRKHGSAPYIVREIRLVREREREREREIRRETETLRSFSSIPCILQGWRNLTVFTIPRTERDETSLWSLFLWFFHVSWFPLMCFFVLVFDFFKYQPPLQRYSSAKSKSALV